MADAAKPPVATKAPSNPAISMAALARSATLLAGIAGGLRVFQSELG